jgi:hypothetical protein
VAWFSKLKGGRLLLKMRQTRLQGQSSDFLGDGKTSSNAKPS